MGAKAVLLSMKKNSSPVVFYKPCISCEYAREWRPFPEMVDPQTRGKAPLYNMEMASKPSYINGLAKFMD